MSHTIFFTISSLTSSLVEFLHSFAIPHDNLSQLIHKLTSGIFISLFPKKRKEEEENSYKSIKLSSSSYIMMNGLTVQLADEKVMM